MSAIGPAILLAFVTTTATAQGTIAISDKSLHHGVIGAGTPIIALHGGLDLDQAYLRKGLAPWTNFAEIHFIDLEGNGRSSRPDDYGTITLETMAQDVFDVADALELETFVLYGHS